MHQRHSTSKTGQPHGADDGNAEGMLRILERGFYIHPLTVGGLEALLHQGTVRDDIETPFLEVFNLVLRLAQFSLGQMYFYGNGVPQDYQEAAKWFRRAAEQGDAGAQFSLGAVYSTGDGVPQNDAEAKKWYHKAAEQGNADAQFSLGQMYFYGNGVPQDYVQAHKWFNLATAREPDEYSPEVIQWAKGESEKVMTGSQVAEAQRLVREWRLKTKE